MDMRKMYRILEIAWLVIAIVGVIMTTYFIIRKDNQGSIFFLIFTFVAGVIYSIRKRQRKIQEGAGRKNQQGK
jgi:FtsH-binding integral membrane protein